MQWGTPLDRRDAGALVDAIQEAHDAASLEEFPALAMRLVGRVVHSDLTSFNDIDPTRNLAVAAVDPPDAALFDGAMERFARLQGEHPVIRYTSETGDGSAHKISDFVTPEQFHALRLYRELYALLDVEYQMSITLPAVLPRIIGIALNRSADRPDFDERDRTMLNLLRPHLAQSYEHARLRARLAERNAALGRLLAQRGEAVVLLEDPPTEATPGAFDLLARFFGPPASGTAVAGPVLAWVAEQRANRDNRRADDVPAPFRVLTAVRDGERLVARFVPGGAHADAIVLTERRAAAASEELRRLGLSRREADVLRHLASGATNADIGERLHIASGTVKKHLDNVYRKLGVGGRVQAVSMSLELLSGGSPGPEPDGPVADRHR